jgi:hypothetical protein
VDDGRGAANADFFFEVVEVFDDDGVFVYVEGS